MSWLVALAVFVQPFSVVRAQTTPPEAPAAEVITNTAGISGTIESAPDISPTVPTENLTSTIVLSDALIATPAVTPEGLTQTLPTTEVISNTAVLSDTPVATATPLPVTVTVAPTLTLVEVLTPTLMPTPTQTVTSTPVLSSTTPDVIDSSTRKSKDGVFLSANTTRVITGQIVEITLIALVQPSKNTLTVSLSDGLEYVSGSHPTAVFDANKHELSIKNPRIGERQVFRIQIQDLSKANDKNKLELTAGDASVRFKLDNWTFYAQTSYEYNALDLLTRVQDAQGNLTSLTYNRLGQKTAMTDPDMGSWSYSYDSNGNLTRQTDAKGQALTFSYDALNRMTDKYVNGTWTSWNRYDETWATGNAIGRRTRSGLGVDMGGYWSNEVYYRYDARGRMTNEHRAIDGAGWFDTNYTYDSADRVTAMQYPNGEWVTTNYNDAMEPASLSGWSSYVSGATYNVLGKPATIDLPNGLRTRFTYMGVDIVNPAGYGNANWGRLRQICVLPQSAGSSCYDWSFNGAGSTNTRMNIGYWYDAAGNVTYFDEYDKGYNTAFGYDALDRLTSASGATNESYSYDAIGNLTSKAGVAMYYWDANHKHAVTNLSSNGNAQMAWYDANGNMFIRKENGTQYNQEWNADNKLTRVTATAGGRNADTRFFYDADGNRVKKVETVSDKPFIVDGFENSNGILWGFSSYQSLDNNNGEPVLKSVGNGQWNWASNFYRGCCDLVHARNMMVDFKVDSPNTMALFSIETNQNGYNRFGVIADGGTIYVQAYKDGAWQYPATLINPLKVNVWYRLRLTVDDASGFKAEVWERDAGSPYNSFTFAMPAGKAWNFHHWINAGTAYIDNFKQSFLSGSKTTVYVGSHYEKNLTTGEATSYYYFNGQRIAMRSNVGVLWLHGDMLGSASLLTDGGGSTVGQARYKPFGEKRSEWNAYFTDRKFTGQREEPALGSLYDYGARFYSPLIGRFISPDSIVQDPSDPQSLNRFSYVGNSPLKFIDPSGHCRDGYGLTRDDLDTLLGSECDGLMTTWEKYDPYWIGTLKNLTSEDRLMTTANGDAILQFTGSGKNIKPGVVGGKASSNLRDWQGKGVNTIMKPGEGVNDDSVGYRRDDLFNSAFGGGFGMVPVFDYSRTGYKYIGALGIAQNIAIHPSTMGGLCGNGVSDYICGYAAGEAIQFVAAGIGAKVGATVGGVVGFGIGLIVDVSVGTAIQSFKSPREYSLYWPGSPSQTPGLNPYLPSNFFTGE